MLAYIKGELVQKQIGYVVIDVGGIGYKIYMSETSIEKLGNIGEIKRINTYYRVSEDDISIFGFNTQEELRMFELLISVSGIGAKTAQAMLGKIEPSKFAIAVISNDLETLKQIPGVGTKSAQRIVLELKDKIKKEQQITELTEEAKSIGKNDNDTSKQQEKLAEATSALQVLGYLKKDIDSILSKIDVKELELEEIIKQALKLL